MRLPRTIVGDFHLPPPVFLSDANYILRDRGFFFMYLALGVGSSFREGDGLVPRHGKRETGIILMVGVYVLGADSFVYTTGIPREVRLGHPLSLHIP